VEDVAMPGTGSYSTRLDLTHEARVQLLSERVSVDCELTDNIFAPDGVTGIDNVARLFDLVQVIFTDRDLLLEVANDRDTPEEYDQRLYWNFTGIYVFPFQTLHSQGFNAELGEAVEISGYADMILDGEMVAEILNTWNL
jgi:hypothetical protein